MRTSAPWDSRLAQEKQTPLMLNAKHSGKDSCLRHNTVQKESSRSTHLVSRPSFKDCIGWVKVINHPEPRFPFMYDRGTTGIHLGCPLHGLSSLKGGSIERETGGLKVPNQKPREGIGTFPFQLGPFQYTGISSKDNRACLRLCVYHDREFTTSSLLAGTDLSRWTERLLLLRDFWTSR